MRQGAGARYADLPQPWASLIARIGSNSGQRALLAIGVVTPPVDGIVISIEGIVPSGMDPGPVGGFEMHVTTSPGVWFAPYPRQIDRLRIGWWAEDNRNNRYLGSQGSWKVSDDSGHSNGTVIYQPALDPIATELRLTPAGLSERVVLTVTVPPGKGRAQG